MERNGLRIVPGFADQDKYDGKADGIGIPVGRQVVTIITPMFTLWVWSALPEWPAHPARVPEAFPALQMRMALQQLPREQVGSLLSGRELTAQA